MQARYTGPFKAARPPLSTTPYRKGWFITTAGSLARRGVFFVKLSFSVRPSTAKRILQTFKSPALFLANAACGAERESRFSWLTRWRPSVAEPGAHELALLLALARWHRRGAAAGSSPEAAGLAVVRRDWQLAASRPASTQLSQLWATRPDGLAKALSARRRASARRQHLELGASAPQESRYGVKLQLQL